ncbi:MAG: hypothetical protein RPR97_05840 [Colwellia sp.]
MVAQEQEGSFHSVVKTSFSMKERDLINIVFSQNPNDKVAAVISAILSSDKISWVLTIIIRDKSYTLCSARSESPRLFKRSDTCLKYIVDNFNRTNSVDILIETTLILALLGANKIQLPVKLLVNGLDNFFEGTQHEERISDAEIA